MAARMPAEVAAYFAAQPPRAAAVLRKVRATIRETAPGAEEKLSYRIPAFTLDGRMLVYYAGFKAHIGLYPPVRGDAALDTALAPYRGEKGNLRFPLGRPMPHALIAQVVRARVKAVREAAQRRK